MADQAEPPRKEKQEPDDEEDILGSAVASLLGFGKLGLGDVVCAIPGVAPVMPILIGAARRRHAEPGKSDDTHHIQPISAKSLPAVAVPETFNSKSPTMHEGRLRKLKVNFKSDVEFFGSLDGISYYEFSAWRAGRFTKIGRKKRMKIEHAIDDLPS